MFAPLCIKPRFSKRFALVLMLIHCGGLLLLLPLMLPLTVKFCIGLLVLASTLHVTRKHLLLINHPLYGCVLRYDKEMGYIKVQLPSEQKTQRVKDSYNHPQLVILRVTQNSDALIIFPDALDVDTFRQLRVHLRYDQNEFFKKK